MEQEEIKSRYNKYAPYWAAVLVILLGTGLLTIWLDFGAFWKGYLLDMVGPGWAYILFRGLFTSKADNIWTRFFNPNRTLFIFLIVCFGIETLQYLKLYDSTPDSWDFLAYISILIPLFLIDQRLINRKRVKLQHSRFV